MASTSGLRLLTLSLVGFFWLSSQVQAEESETAPQVLDQIVLKNGSIIMGTVTGSRDGVVSIDTDFAGTLSVTLDQVAAVQTHGPVVIQLADKTVISDQPLRIESEELLVSSDAIAQQSYAISELAVVNPEPWELGQGYKWSGLVSLALLMERGNTDTDELDYKMKSVWRSWPRVQDAPAPISSVAGFWAKKSRKVNSTSSLSMRRAAVRALGGAARR